MAKKSRSEATAPPHKTRRGHIAELIAHADAESVFVIERGKTAERIGAEMRNPGGRVVTLSDPDRGDGGWALDMTGDGSSVWFARAVPLDDETLGIHTGALALAFRYMVLHEVSDRTVLVEDPGDLPVVLEAFDVDSVLW